MAVLARRPFTFAGRDIAAGEPVIGLDGQQPDGHQFTRLLAAHYIYVTNDNTGDGDGDVVAGVGAATARTARKRAAQAAADPGDN